MEQAQESGRRLVNRGEYAWLHLKTAAALLFSAALLPVFSILCLIMCGLVAALSFIIILGACAAVSALLNGDASGLSALARDGSGLFMPSVVCGAATYASGKWIEALTKYNPVENVVLFTHANTAYLAAPNSLVRASRKPAQAQKDTLVRAVTQTQDTQDTQLLRAAAQRQA